MLLLWFTTSLLPNLVQLLVLLFSLPCVVWYFLVFDIYILTQKMCSPLNKWKKIDPLKVFAHMIILIKENLEPMKNLNIYSFGLLTILNNSIFDPLKIWTIWKLSIHWKNLLLFLLPLQILTIIYKKRTCAWVSGERQY